MPKGPQGQKRPTDVIGNAVQTVTVGSTAIAGVSFVVYRRAAIRRIHHTLKVPAVWFWKTGFARKLCAARRTYMAHPM